MRKLLWSAALSVVMICSSGGRLLADETHVHALPAHELDGDKIDLIEHMGTEAVFLFVDGESINSDELKQAVEMLGKVHEASLKDGDDDDKDVKDVDVAIVVLGDPDKLKEAVAKAHADMGIVEPSFVADPNEEALKEWKLPMEHKWCVVHVTKGAEQQVLDSLEELKAAIDDLAKAIEGETN